MNILEGFILFGRFNLKTCNVCKALIRRSHNLLVYVKVIKNVRRSDCQVIAINFLITFQNNQMNYANLPNHDNLSMI